LAFPLATGFAASQGLLKDRQRLLVMAAVKQLQPLFKRTRAGGFRRRQAAKPSSHEEDQGEHDWAAGIKAFHSWSAGSSRRS
jgi:hypothetical protein